MTLKEVLRYWLCQRWSQRQILLIFSVFPQILSVSFPEADQRLDARLVCVSISICMLCPKSSSVYPETQRRMVCGGNTNNTLHWVLLEPSRIHHHKPTSITPEDQRAPWHVGTQSKSLEEGTVFLGPSQDCSRSLYEMYMCVLCVCPTGCICLASLGPLDPAQYSFLTHHKYNLF